MKIFFVDETASKLADKESSMLVEIRRALLKERSLTEVMDPGAADVILLQEKGCFKNFRYINELSADPLIARYGGKVFTINNDDCATGLLRGLYTSLPRSRFNPALHAVVPFMHYPNGLVFERGYEQKNSRYLASWRGNTMSNRLRVRMISSLRSKPEFYFETTNSWLNHPPDEKQTYVRLILDSKFSLCPAGWAPVTYRIYESMALGRCPVIIADDFVPPQGPDWNQFALFFPEKNIAGLGEFLHEHAHLAEGLGRKAYQVWNHFFAAPVLPMYCAQTLLTLMRNAAETNYENEFRRWTSLEFYWSNKWTLPQRVVNRVSRWSRMLV